MALRRNNEIDATSWERVKDLVAAALECRPPERQSFLADLAQEGPSITQEVARLVSSHERAGTFLDGPLALPPDFLEDLGPIQRFSAGDVLCGRFRVVRLIGKGGMGEVYEASDQELDESVALKTLRSEASGNEVFTSRFRREIQLARKVTHPNVCRIFESLRHQTATETVSVLSMELLQGQTLADHLNSKGRLTANEALPLARQIIEGLAAVHAAGIIHRDLKPSNLVLVPDADMFRVKITDFGIAGHLAPDPSLTSMTQAGKMLGTPDYMSPEQLEHGRATIQSDIYALGLVLYEMVTGTKPFAEATAFKRLYEDAVPPRKLQPDLPENWNKSIVCCLERNPEYRFADTERLTVSLAGNSSASAIPAKPFLMRLKTAAQKGIWLLLAFLVVSAAIPWSVLKISKPQLNLQDGAMLLFPEIENTTGDQQLEAVTDLMRNQLEQSAKFSLIDRTQMNSQLRQMGKPIGGTLAPQVAREVAWRARAGILLMGTLSRAGNGYTLRVTAQAIGTTPGTASRTWEQSFSAVNKEGIFDLVHQASGWFRSLAEKVPIQNLKGDFLPQSTTTSSWEALLLFSQAERLKAAGQTHEAIDLLQQSVALDKDFSLAYMRLGDLYDSLGEEKKGFQEWQKALATLARRTVTQKEELRIRGLYAQDTGDFKAAEEIFKNFEILYPNEYLASFYLASTQEDLGRLEDALATIRRSEQKQPDAYTPIAHEARLAMVLGKFDNVDKALERLRALHREGAAYSIEVGFKMLQQDFAGSLKALDSLEASEGPFYKSKSYSLRAAFLRELGRDNDAIRALNNGIAYDQSQQFTVSEADKWLALAYTYLRTGALSSCRKAALAGLKLENGRIHVLHAGTILARAGYIQDAKRALAMLPLHTGLQASDQAWHELHGEILAAQHYGTEALTEMREAVRQDIPASQKEYLARVLEMTGHNDEAALIYRAIVQSPAQVWQAPDYQFPGIWSDDESRFENVTTLEEPVMAHGRAMKAKMIAFAEHATNH